MVEKRIGWVPPTSRLGILIQHEGKVAANRVELVEKINQRTGSDIKPFDFLALGPDYFKTEPGKRNARIIYNYLNDLEQRRIGCAENSGDSTDDNRPVRLRHHQSKG